MRIAGPSGIGDFNCRIAVVHGDVLSVRSRSCGFSPFGRGIVGEVAIVVGVDEQSRLAGIGFVENHNQGGWRFLRADPDFTVARVVEILWSFFQRGGLCVRESQSLRIEAAEIGLHVGSSPFESCILRVGDGAERERYGGCEERESNLAESRTWS